MIVSSIRSLVIASLVAPLVLLAACDDGGGGDGGPDSTSRLERGIDRVGDKLETAAADVGTAVNESRVQMIIDNIKGMDSVQVEITDDGAVTLIGSVASDAVRTDAERLVQSIEGVDVVRNSIAVAGVTAPAGGSSVAGDSSAINDSAANRR